LEARCALRALGLLKGAERLLQRGLETGRVVKAGQLCALERAQRVLERPLEIRHVLEPRHALSLLKGGERVLEGALEAGGHAAREPDKGRRSGAPGRPRAGLLRALKGAERLLERGLNAGHVVEARLLRALEGTERLLQRPLEAAGDH